METLLTWYIRYARTHNNTDNSSILRHKNNFLPMILPTQYVHQRLTRMLQPLRHILPMLDLSLFDEGNHIGQEPVDVLGVEREDEEAEHLELFLEEHGVVLCD